jgi:hypothetical protein
LNFETVADFVTRKFRDPLGTLGTALTDGDGNVGIIVGAAGRNKAVQFDPEGNPFVYSTQPASNVQNGSLTNLLARNLMSAVAGSVDRIASIQVSRAIQILAGEVGSDKIPLGSSDYRDRSGNPVTSPVPDGRLVDGALITASLVDANGNPTSLAGRVFFLPA